MATQTATIIGQDATAERPLPQILRRLRARVFYIDTLAGLGWGLVAGVLGILIAVWLDLMLELPPVWRIAGLGLAVIAVGALLIRKLIGAFGRSGSDRLASRLDDVSETGGQIRSGFDLLNVSRPARPESHSARSSLTRGLAELAVVRAAELAGRVVSSAAVPIRPAGRAFAAVALVGFLTGMLCLAMPRLAKTQWLRFSDPYGDHPAYSRVHLSVEPQGVDVVYGDGLDVYVTKQGPPVEAIELVLERSDGRQTDGRQTNGRQRADAPPGDEVGSSDGSAADVIPMFREPDGRWRASIANVTQPLKYFARSHRARSPRYAVNLITVPRIEEVRFRIAPPAYTRQSSYEGRLPDGGLAGLPGTQVNVHVRSNRPLSGGRLTFTAGDETVEHPLQPDPENARSVRGTFPIMKTGGVQLRVVDVAGQPSKQTFSTAVHLLDDERPFVRLLQPRAVSFATPTARIPVVISAEDDYGISRLQLYRSLNESRYLPMEIPVAEPPPRTAYDVVHLPLSEYGLRPGDQIRLFARVVDNDPNWAGERADDATADRVEGKGSESSVAVLRIISQDEFNRLRRTREGLNMLMSKYQQARRRMESLAQEIETLQKESKQSPAGSELAEKQREQLQRLTKRLEDEAEALRKLAETGLSYQLDKELTDKLNELAEGLQRLVKKTDSLANKPAVSHQELQRALSEMLKQIGQQRKRLDTEIMQPLDLLAAVFPLAECESRFVQLYRRQRDLADRLASLKGRDDADDPARKVRMRDLEDEQRQVRRDLTELLEDIENRATRLPDDGKFDELRETALKFVREVCASGATEAMVEAESGLAEFSGSRGHAEAKKAAGILEAFLSKCSSMGMGGQAGACLRFQPGLSDCLGTTIQQLLADAGLGQGSGGIGGGAGGQGGYSARRSTLQNVGLYGGLPALSGPTTSGTGLSSQQVQGTGRAGSRPGDNEASAYQPPSVQKASGAGAATVPLQYRRKVGRYFQRIADEIGER